MKRKKGKERKKRKRKKAKKRFHFFVKKTLKFTPKNANYPWGDFILFL
jgi:hypothetical protein